MRVLVLTSLYPNPISPHSCAHNRQQIHALSRQADIMVIAPIAWTQEWSARRRGGRGVMKDRGTQLESVVVRHPRYLYPPAVFRRWHGHCYRLSVRKAFAHALWEFRPDVIYAPFAYPDGWSAARLGHEAGLPVVIKVMGSDVHALPEYPARRRGTLEALEQADRIIAVSRQLADEVVALGADRGRVHVVYNGVDRKLFHPGSRGQARRRLGLNPDLRRILFVGNLVPVKQVDVLLEACRRLAPIAEPFRCHLVGDGPLRTELAARIDQDGLSNVVSLEGPRPHAELPLWYQAADVVVLPSRSEGVPNVLLEAQASGVPVIASRVGGIPEIVTGEPDRLIASGDSAGFAEAIGQVLSNATSRGNFVKGPLDWEDSAGALKTVLEDAVGIPPADRGFLPSFDNGSGELSADSSRPVAHVGANES